MILACVVFSKIRLLQMRWRQMCKLELSVLFITLIHSITSVASVTERSMFPKFYSQANCKKKKKDQQERETLHI